MGAYFFTKEQYDEIVSLLKNKPDKALSATTAGISKALLVSKIFQERIIDTSATNYMVADNILLDSYAVIKTDCPKQLFLPNGDVSFVTHIGASTLCNMSTINNVLQIN